MRLATSVVANPHVPIARELVKNPKVWGPGPSNSSILSWCIVCICAIWSELKRGNEVELADLTRDMRKNNFLEPDFFSAATQGYAPALCSQGKEREWEGKIIWRPGSCSRVSDLTLEGLKFKSRVACALGMCEDQFFGTRFVFSAISFFKLSGNTMFQVPKSIHI